MSAPDTPRPTSTGSFFRITRRIEDEAHAPAVVPPCPPWCTLEPGHLDFDDRTDGGYFRVHEAHAGGLAWISAEECSDGQGGPVTLTPPVLLVDGSDYHGEGRTPAEVRALAAGLLEVAALVERISDSL